MVRIHVGQPILPFIIFQIKQRLQAEPANLRLPVLTLWCKVESMNPNWAEENLQTIRTLMERSALYRRALAPIMLFVGIIGTLAALAGLYFHVESPREFAALWLGTAGVAVAGAFLLARRQAIKDQESFWSPPGRPVGQALLPPLLCGLFAGAVLVVPDANWVLDFGMAVVWMLFYGCALNSAGFFMTRGIKWFGWIFIVGAIGIAALLLLANASVRPWCGNLMMGLFFGVLHLAYGIYLYLTEKKNPVA